MNQPEAVKHAVLTAVTISAGFGLATVASSAYAEHVLGVPGGIELVSCGCIGFLLFAVLLLVAWLITRKRPRATRYCANVLAGLASAAVVGTLTTASYSPEATFERITSLESVPGSVRILNWRIDSPSGVDETVWLHFTASPADMEKILAARQYEAGTSNMARLSDPPKWWAPDRLDDPTRYVCDLTDRDPPDRANFVVSLWVNRDRTEAMLRGRSY
ncbi:MAG: hypothetical protein WBF17_14455 [Phycisphaerae bacterium]